MAFIKINSKEAQRIQAEQIGRSIPFPRQVARPLAEFHIRHVDDITIIEASISKKPEFKIKLDPYDIDPYDL